MGYKPNDDAILVAGRLCVVNRPVGIIHIARDHPIFVDQKGHGFVVGRKVLL